MRDFRTVGGIGDGVRKGGFGGPWNVGRSRKTTAASRLAQKSADFFFRKIYSEKIFHEKYCFRPKRPFGPVECIVRRALKPVERRFDPWNVKGALASLKKGPVDNKKSSRSQSHPDSRCKLCEIFVGLAELGTYREKGISGARGTSGEESKNDGGIPFGGKKLDFFLECFSKSNK